MTKKFTDVIIRFDSEHNLVSVRPASGLPLPEQFSSFRVDELDTVELIEAIGETVIAYLNTVHPGVFLDEMLNSDYLDGEPESFVMARKMIAQIGDSSSLEDIEAAESMLRRVSAAGDDDAANYLDGPWQSLKAVLTRRISRRSD